MTRVLCPVAACRAENDSQTELCIRCNTPLQSYTRLFFYPSQLFNHGLAAAREGRFRQARDLFAAVVQWCPKDIEARNTLAMACFALKDWSEARRQWNIVQAQSP
ncbi:MAG TPA: tetratricopeptide repeat protein, partial [Ktedonobacteraceae bacterium]|nr:tetratricopeptide repeat protein [Ktedonobacteraceae bacterium]